MVTSCCVHHGSETGYDKFKLTRETPSAVHTQPEEHSERTEHTALYSSSWATLQQRSSRKMVVEPLLLNHSEYALSLLKELGSSNIRNAKPVAIIQNTAIYYQCLVTKRQLGTIFAECWPAAIGTIIYL